MFHQINCRRTADNGQVTLVVRTNTFWIERAGAKDWDGSVPDFFFFAGPSDSGTHVFFYRLPSNSSNPGKIWIFSKGLGEPHVLTIPDSPPTSYSDARARAIWFGPPPPKGPSGPPPWFIRDARDIWYPIWVEDTLYFWSVYEKHWLSWSATAGRTDSLTPSALTTNLTRRSRAQLLEMINRNARDDPFHPFGFVTKQARGTDIIRLDSYTAALFLHDLKDGAAEQELRRLALQQSFDCFSSYARWPKRGRLDVRWESPVAAALWTASTDRLLEEREHVSALLDFDRELTRLPQCKGTVELFWPKSVGTIKVRIEFRTQAGGMIPLEYDDDKLFGLSLRDRRLGTVMHFSVDHLPPGKYTVSAVWMLDGKEMARCSPQEVELVQEQETKLKLRLQE